MFHKPLCAYSVLFFMLPFAVLFAQDKPFDLQGHRGARGLMPENSLPGFQKALDLKVNTLELDVVISKDKQCVLSHEPFLSHEICTDPSGKPITEQDEQKWNLYQMTVQEIQQCDCGSQPHPRFPEQQKMKTVKPTLLEMIAAAEAYVKEKGLQSVYYNIETKSKPEGDDIFHPKPDEFARLLYAELGKSGVIDRVFIQSFDVRTLQAFRKIDSKIPLVLLVENKEGFKANIKKLGFTPAIYSPNFQLLSPELVKEVHAKGMKIVPWTINEKADMIKIMAMGVDGLITDYPNRFFELK